MTLHPDVLDVTDRIAERSADARSAYLERIRAAAKRGPARGELGCANLAHGFAACGPDDSPRRRGACPRHRTCPPSRPRSWAATPSWPRPASCWPGLGCGC